MKRVIRMVSVGVMVLGAVEAFAADPLTNDQRVKWLSTVTDGCYNDPANWTDGILPANGIDGRYGYVDFQTQDITLRAPAGGLVENSGSIFLGTGAGTHTLTIDTRGTFWEKKGLKSVNNWWGSPFAQNLTGTHIFNFEGLDSVANEKQVWRFEDALFTWKSTGTSRQDFDLWSGTFTFGKDLYLGSSGGAVNFYIHPEASCIRPRRTSSSAVTPRRTRGSWAAATRWGALCSRTTTPTPEQPGCTSRTTPSWSRAGSRI